MVNLVLITSIIKTPDNPLSYTNFRSVYSHEERYIQTKKTIESVKEKIPNVKIFIVECSDLDEEQNLYFKNNSDYFLNLYDNIELRNNMHSKSKSLCEGTMTFCALENIINNNIEFENLIKISGRYYLSDNFNYENFNNDNIVIKYIDNNLDNVFTALYKLPNEYIKNLKIFLENNFDKMFSCIGYENLFSIFIRSINLEKIKNVNPIGLEGYVSVSKDFYRG